MFDLKGHIRSNKALYVYILSSTNSSVKPLLSLYASSSLSLSRSSSLFLYLQNNLCIFVFEFKFVVKKKV